MNIDDATIRRLTPEESKETVKARLEALLLAKQEVLVPEPEEEKVINMNRQQRRAWAREQVRRLKAR